MYIYNVDLPVNCLAGFCCSAKAVGAQKLAVSELGWQPRIVLFCIERHLSPPYSLIFFVDVLNAMATPRIATPGCAAILPLLSLIVCGVRQFALV
jgi:hypothetical protein